MLSEPQVTESVEGYFSEPQFNGFYTQREVRIQIGSSARRADIALYTDSSSPQIIVIIECKGEGITSIQQLHSYLSASATELGIFANTGDPNEWHYVRNLGGNQFDNITRANFENRLEELRPIPEPQQRRDLMNDTKRRARAALFELKEAVLIVLLEAREAGEGHIQLEKIRQRLGIPKVNEIHYQSNTLIRGIFFHLQADGLVQSQANVGWEVTDKAASLLDDA